MAATSDPSWNQTQTDGRIRTNKKPSPRRCVPHGASNTSRSWGPYRTAATNIKFSDRSALCKTPQRLIFWPAASRPSGAAVRPEMRPCLVNQTNIERFISSDELDSGLGKTAGPKHAHEIRATSQRPGVYLRGGIYLRGLPRLANTSPRSSAVQRRELANLRASLRSGPGAIWRACSKASAAATSQSNRSVER